MPGPSHPSPDIHIDLNVWGLPPSATVAMHERSIQLERQGRQVYKLGFGQSPFPVPPCVVEELRRNAFRKNYLPVQGLPELREAVAEHHRRTYGIECEPDCVLIGPGSKELMFLLQLVYYGEIVIPTPAWVSYAAQTRIVGRPKLSLSTCASDGWRLTADQLDEVCQKDPGRPRIVFLNYPCNPTGVTYELQELRDLATVARKHRVVILSDEIYGKLHHTGGHTSIVPLYPEGSIFSGGLSKWCGAGGWRLGLFVIPRGMAWLLEAMTSVASETFTSTTAPIQYAAVRAYQGGSEIERYLQRCRRVLSALGRTLARLLEKAGIRVLAPQGGFYLFPDFSPVTKLLNKRGVFTSYHLCERLLMQTGVALLPGAEFGRPAEELTARLAYVDFDGGRALQALERLTGDQAIEARFLETYCGPTIRAVELLCEWVHEPGRR